ncbi:hypothetical protein P0Y35_08675 [Kiritimatiellaeota bacterium B1221]|nr:hypothetical protein [Kiritimatiellaeota bacterium B1221]
MTSSSNHAWDRKLKSTANFIEQMDLFRKPILREVAPGKFVPTAGTSEDLPDVMLCRIRDLGNGEVSLEPYREEWMRMDEDNLKLLGLEKSRHTILRLAAAGFIEALKVAPHTWMLNLTSYYNHLRRIAEAQADGENFWEEGNGNREAYREAGGWS